MSLTDRQIEKLKSLASAEEHHAILARGMVDARVAAVDALLRLSADIARLEGHRRHRGNQEIAESIGQQLAALNAEKDRTVAANDRRQKTAEHHLAIAGSLTATIDAVCAHAGTSRLLLGINYFRDDPSNLHNLSLGPQ